MADTSPWLLVGLGNPGAKYAANRHNVGFMVVERWVDRHLSMPAWRDKHKARECSISSGVPGGGRCVALEPQTFMNLSGESVGPAMRFHRVPVERVIVVHDELDFEVGRVAIKRGGGHGGHNGLRDIIRVVGSPNFIRVRVGIGRPRHGEVSHWVLTDFTGDDAIAIDPAIVRADEAVDAIMDKGVAAAMNDINTQPKAAEAAG